jgi:hypothetical protein
MHEAQFYASDSSSPSIVDHPHGLSFAFTFKGQQLRLGVILPIRKSGEEPLGQHYLARVGG